MCGQRLIAVFGHDEAVPHLGAEGFSNTHRAIDRQHHAGCQHRLVAKHQLWFLKKAVAGRPAAAERILVTRPLNDLGIGRVHRLGCDPGSQYCQGRRLTVERGLVDRLLRGIGHLTDPEGAIETQFEAVKVGHPAEAQEDRFATAHHAGAGAVVRHGDLFA